MREPWALFKAREVAENLRQWSFEESGRANINLASRLSDLAEAIEARLPRIKSELETLRKKAKEQ